MINKTEKKTRLLENQMFSFCHCFYFKRDQNVSYGIRGQYQTLSETSPCFLFFTCLQYKSIENIAGKKEKLLLTSNFSFSHIVLFPFGKLSAIFTKFEIVVCKLFSFGRG